jgi:hypothetical protein
VLEGWSCPKCELVLAPSVASHRCTPPSAGVTTTSTVPLTPFQPTSVSMTHPGTVTTTFAHHGAITEVYAPRLEIAGGTAA